ncbi:ABC transporter ATP-binding protein [Ketogulonicigenium vulgare]|uniref:ABC transporter ATP-binding protein n=1 Tax=Ketogulonicigenium vulgare TaxID=92945 RepID=UPI0023582E36|nr:sn-glycerol-3-phosphate ABC transporter ATP-binding protein UgpC [Ketogulonicigenium vulgare]
MADLKLDKITKSYGAYNVLHGIDLKISEGEFVVLVGPSGCGKSTLLRMIAGLEDLTSGDMVVGGKLYNDVPPQKRNIAMVFQSYALFPHLNVRDNISYGQKLRGEPADEIARKVDWAAGVLNLTPYLDRFPRQLSGGQRQRVAMGRAIVRAPSLFLYDEPLSNLDAQLRVQMRTEIKALHKKVGTTSIYVTHDQIEAMTLADRVVVMNAGRIEQVGTPLDLFDRPQTTFVAGFIGSPAMNMLPAIYTHGRIVMDDASAGAIPLPAGYHLPEGATLTIGIRPEHLQVTADEGLNFTSTIVEQTGSDTYVYGTLGGAAATMMFRERTAIADNTQLRVTAAPGKLHLFDRETGLRILEVQA